MQHRSFRSPADHGRTRPFVPRDAQPATPAAPERARLDEDVGERTVSDYLAILKRRKRSIRRVGGAILALAIFFAVMWPATYRSTATILIEEQEIPADLVRSTITGFADERIQVISQQVMTRSNLIQLVDRFGLYGKMREREPIEVVLEKLRKDITFETVSAETADRKTGQKNEVTIAFQLSYDSGKPDTAQLVASELVSMYLNENLKNRQQRTTETSAFIGEEAGKVSEQIADIDRRMASFKEKNSGQLPEFQQLNLQLRERAENEVLELDRQIRSAEERRFYLQGQLGQIRPNSPIISADGQRVPDSYERLRALQAQYVAMQATYSADHPDVVKARREIDALRSELRGGTDRQVDTGTADALSKARADLQAARERYSPEHPDVVRLQRTIRSLETQLRQQRARPEAAIYAGRPDNPAYIALQAQSEAATQEIASLRERQSDARKRATDLNTKLAASPQVEREYSGLMRERENSVTRFQELRAKQMEAEVAQQLEKERKGERFSLIDPPQLPERAYRPHRPAIVAIGMLLALAGGFGWGAVREMLDTTVRDRQGLERLARAPVLAAVPYLRTRREDDRVRRRKTMMWLAVLVAAVLALLVMHFTIMPLDTAWFVLSRKFGG